MKKRIEQLLNGKFKYEQPELLFSQDKIEVTLKAGETFRGDVYLGAEDDSKLSGYITSSNRRIVPGTERFSGATVCVPYGIDAVGLKPGDSFDGWICFTTNIGEYKLPVHVEAEKEEVRTAAGEVKTLEEFTEIAKNDFREGYRLFTDKAFGKILENTDGKTRSLYAGMSCQPVTYQHVEEFLVGTGQKEKVEISLASQESICQNVQASRKESFVLHRSGWGHLRLEIEAHGEFLEVSKKVVTDQDFIGSVYQVEYVIHRSLLGKGSCCGEIQIKSPYQTLVFSVKACLGAGDGINRDLKEKQHKIALTRDYLDYRCGAISLSEWTSNARYELNELFETGFDYPEYHIYDAYLQHMQGEDEKAREILKTYQDKVFAREELELAGMYLYLCMETGLYTDRVQGVRKIQNFYMQKGDSVSLLWILLHTDREVAGSFAKALFLMEELFDRGCRSPLLYLEAWETLCKDISLLHRINPFWTQVFLFAGKRGLLTEELSMRFAYLCGYEKKFSESLYRVLAFICEAFPTEDSLEAVCKYIMLGNPRKPEYFRWFSQAVEQGLKLTRLFEYYMETMDTSYQRELPKPLLMYFTYNTNTLGDTKKAFMFASIIANKEKDRQTYESYRGMMEDFAVRKMSEGRMNEDYAAIYQEFLGNPKTEAQGRAIASRLFTCRLFCDDKKVRSVIVRHNQMEREEIYPCSHGVAYPRIYTDDAAVIFQDEQQRRYAVTVDYNIKKLIDEGNLVQDLVKLGVKEPGVLLHYCETVPLDSESLKAYEMLACSSACTKAYRESLRRKLLNYYAEHVHGEDLDDYLKKMDYREYALVDRTKLLEVLISRGLFSQAMGIIEEQGCEGIDMRSLLKVTSRMILRGELAEDEELLALASQVYRSGIYDEVILKYLMQYRMGPIDELLAVRRSAVGFEMDTYELDERILKLLMYTSDYRKEGETILEAYVKQAGKEPIIAAYLTQLAYGVFVREYPMSTFVQECLMNAWEKEWPVNLVCRLALLKALAQKKNPDEQQLQVERKLLEECVENHMVFGFFRRLSPTLLSPYQLDDKVYVEYHGSPKAKVTLWYSLDTGLSRETEYRSEPLRNMYEGIFTKTFTLFYGESLHYYFSVEENGKTRKTSERVLSMSRVEGNPMSKYQMINQMLSARRLEKESEVLAKMKQYLRQEQYVKDMFPIEEEA